MKIPSNIHFELLDLSFPGTNAYRPVDGKVSLEAVKKNRDIVKEHFGIKELFVMEQVHGLDVHYADFERPIGEEIAGDGSYTDQKGMLLYIGTADCVPVVFFAEDGSAIGAVHAGWKGAKGNIMAHLHKKLSLISKNISAIICPSIFQQSYEVGPEFYDEFMNQSEENSRFFIDSENPGHKMFDIRGLVRHKLSKLDLENIHMIEEDTYSHKLPNGEYKYPSYRRFCHGSGEPYPRTLGSVIMIKD